MPWENLPICEVIHISMHYFKCVFLVSIFQHGASGRQYLRVKDSIIMQTFIADVHKLIQLLVV